MNNRQIGAMGEDIAKNYLIENEFTILEQNYRNKIGEIDLIAKKNNEIVFVEVKSRNNLNYGYPSEAVNMKKQFKILNTSKVYISSNKLNNSRLRYDVIEVYLKDNNINHIENAFWSN
jgi:putative endonuclease